MSNWFNAGRVRPVAKGEWSSAANYAVLDYVIAPNGLKTYIATKDVPVGTPLDNTDYWQVLVDAAALEKRAVDKLTSPFSEIGSVVSCHPVEDYPLEVKTIIEPVQAGSGDPAPDNIRAITGHMAANLTRCGANLLPFPYVSKDGYSANGLTFTVNADQSVTVNGTATAETFFIVSNAIYLEAGTYYCDGVPVGESGGAARPQFYMRNSDKSYVNSIYMGGEVLTITKSDNYVFYIDITKGNTLTNAVFKPMLVKGDAPVKYEPYHGDTFTVDFGQTVYGGNLDWDTGVLTIDNRLLALNGSESFYKMSSANSTQSSVFYLKLSDAAKIDWGGSICSHFTNAHEAVWAVKFDGAVGVYCDNASASTNYNNKYFRWGTGGTTVEEWTAYLAAQYAAGTPVQICYELAEPITIQLTPQQILALRGTNTLWSDAGNTSVSGRIAPEWLNDQLKNAIIALGGHV